jgi:NADH-quinone oxidoreductase subunit I
MTNEYELAGPTRAGLIFEKQDLLAPMLGGMLAAPHPMVPGTTDQDYYQGNVTQAVPEQQAWVDARAADDVDPVDNVTAVEPEPEVAK